MCGFAGFINDRSDAVQRRHTAEKMGAQLARRGPDDEQIVITDDIGFVFRRLSIVDPAKGRQPIWNEDKTIFAAVNGEIYNHKELRKKLRKDHHFRTDSDSEIVLHLFEEYGAEMLQWLNGMFAIAIWDTRQNALFIARDRLGIKPLYYTVPRESGTPFLFGSEVKALLPHPRCPRQFDWEDLAVAQGFRPTRLTSFVKGVRQLPGGYYGIYRNGEFRETRYWSLAEIIQRGPDESKGSRHFRDQYAALLEESVAMRLMSDVPIGSFLSGGLDSAVITAIAAKAVPGFQCFNIRESTGVESGDSGRTDQLARHLGISLHRLFIDYETAAQELDFSLETFEYFIWMADAPLFDPEWVFKHELHKMAQTVDPQLRVILIGQGADEFCGGYSNPYDAPRADWDSYIKTLRFRHQREMFKEQGVPMSMMGLVNRVSGDDGGGTDCAASLPVYHGEMLQRVLSLQFHNLRHEDRTGAARGIEARVPFLDHRLVELAASVPEGLHGELFWDKRIIREAAAKWLPRALHMAPKVRFFANPDKTPIHTLMLNIANRVFPQFREAYLLDSASIFSEPRLSELFQFANSGGRGAVNALRNLIQCMATAVFERMSRIGGAGMSMDR